MAGHQFVALINQCLLKLRYREARCMRDAMLVRHYGLINLHTRTNRTSWMGYWLVLLANYEAAVSMLFVNDWKAGPQSRVKSPVL